MRPVFRVLILLLIASAFSITVSAQICTGSLGAPVINETFGNGGISLAPGPPLPDGFTTLKYNSDNCGGEDDTYALLSSMGTTCKGGTWKYLQHDHTGDKNGYMMVINAADDPGIFFTYVVKGDKLCPNTTYQFAAWVLNILRDLPQTQGYSEPNITFSIEKADGTVLQTINTGDIKADDREIPSWKQYGTFFTSPNDGSDIIVKMTNYGKGGLGNDLAIDDITFSPCGPFIQVGFGTIGDLLDRSSCDGDNFNYTLVARQQGYLDPGYQWQVNKNDGNGWVDIAGANATNYIVNVPDAVVTKYQYRIGVLSSANAGSEKCRIYSDPLNINVYAIPTFVLAPNTSTCVGQVLQLLDTSTGDSDLWTGPNNFTSTAANPVVTAKATNAYDGVYTLKITKNGCPYFSTTVVKVYDSVTVAPLKDTTICEGEIVHLNVKSTNATSFKWEPSAGLDHDDIPNPIASPAATTTYRVFVTNSGCTGSIKQATETITVNRLPAANAGKNIRMFDGDKTKLNGTASGDRVNIFWTPTDFLDDPASLTPTTTAPGNITYTLHVQSTVGCGESTSTVFVRVYKKLTIVNTFTPNGDGINDYWTIKNIDDYPHVEVSVFDRYGQAVFHNIGYGKPWDGTCNNKKVPAGTYYYIIDLHEDNLPLKSGWVAVL